MKATITFEDNDETDEVTFHVDFGSGMNQESAAHHMAVAAMKGVARYLKDAYDDEEEDDYE